MSDPTSIFGLHAAALPLRQERMQVIAANLANADTPGYKAQDVDFAAALQAATSGRGGPGLRASAPGHFGTGNGEAADVARLYRVPTQPSLDGNTVDSHMEHAAFAQAALEYRASLNFMEGKVRSLLTAITGQ